MKLDKYEVKSEETLTVFEFTSEGPKGRIPKLIKFTQTSLKELYTLAFGDKDSVSGDIDDITISNNNDSDKVLATVVATVYAFYEMHPEAWVYAKGSTKSRTRLYRMGVSKYYDEIILDFKLFGLKGGNWQEFHKDVDYEALLVKRKKL